MAITLTKGATTLELPEDLLWVNEFRWSPRWHIVVSVGNAGRTVRPLRSSLEQFEQAVVVAHAGEPGAVDGVNPMAGAEHQAGDQAAGG